MGLFQHQTMAHAFTVVAMAWKLLHLRPTEVVAAEASVAMASHQMAALRSSSASEVPCKPLAEGAEACRVAGVATSLSTEQMRQ